MAYYTIENAQLEKQFHAPRGSVSFVRAAAELLPPQIGRLHEQFHTWGELGVSPGPVLAHRIWIGDQDRLYFHFPGDAQPEKLSAAGLAPDLAAWLVLLDKWMETFVVVARARATWTPLELAGALRFTTPAYLPASLTTEPPDNWAHVAHALAVAIVDGPLAGAPQDRHWRDTDAA